MGPLQGLRVIELAGIGPCPMSAMLLAELGADVVRVDRLTDSGLGIGHGPGIPPPQPQPAEHRGRSQAPRRRRDRASPRRRRRRAHRGVPARRHRTSRSRSGGLRGPESEAGLRPGDRMGTGRTARQGGRARLELHRADGRPERNRPARRASHPASQSRRRLRWRCAVPRARGRRGSVRGEGVRAGADRRCRDGRRRRVAHDLGLCSEGSRNQRRPPRREHPRQRRSLLRRLRDERRKVRLDRPGRAQVLRGAARSDRTRRRRSAPLRESRRLAREQGAAGGPVPHPYAGRVVRESWKGPTPASHRCSGWTKRTAIHTTPRAARSSNATVSFSRTRRRASTGPRAGSGARRPRPGAARGQCWSTGASRRPKSTISPPGASSGRRTWIRATKARPGRPAEPKPLRTDREPFAPSAAASGRRTWIRATQTRPGRPAEPEPLRTDRAPFAPSAAACGR